MNKHKALLAFVLFVLGLAGIASILTMELPLPPDVEAILKARYSPEQIKMLLLINYKNIQTQKKAASNCGLFLCPLALCINTCLLFLKPE